MLVSSSPCRYATGGAAAGSSTGIRVVRSLFGRTVLIGAEGVQGDVGSGTRHAGELLARDEPPAPPQRNQLPDLVPVPGHSERLPALDSVHDLFGPVTEITLGDLRLSAHGATVRGVGRGVLLGATVGVEPQGALPGGPGDRLSPGAVAQPSSLTNVRQASRPKPMTGPVGRLLSRTGTR